MNKNQTGNDIKQGFDAIAGGVKEAGRKRTAEIVAKNGYVAFKNPEAVAQFHADPYYADWSCTFVDGEYRFFPAKKEKEIYQNLVSQDIKLLETYKETIKNRTKSTFVSISILQENSSKCKYELLSIDKQTGEKTKMQEDIVDFYGKFSNEILPSIYNQLANGFPAIDNEKEGRITFQNIDNSKVMSFSNLNYDQLQLIKNMKSYVDSQYILKEQETNKFHR